MRSGPELVLSFAQHLKKIGKKEATVQSYCRDISQFLNFLNSNSVSLSSVDQDTLLHYRNAIQAKNLGGKSSSFRRAVISIRQFYKMLPYFSSLQITSLENVPIPIREEPRPRKLKDTDIESLLRTTKHMTGLKEARDHAIVTLFSFEGIKVSELTELEWKHYLNTNKKGSLLIPGERKRLIILNSKTNEALCHYQNMVQENRNILPKNYKMFLGFKGRDIPLIAPKVSRHGLKFMLYELGEACRIPGLNTEVLRHYAIQHQLDGGSNPEEVMRHLGLRQIGNISKHHKVKKDYDR